MAKKPKKEIPDNKPNPVASEQPYLTPEDLVFFKHLLLEKRAEIIGDVSSMESDALKKSRLDAAGDLSSMPIHMADIGTDNYEQEFALGLLDSERKLLHEINDALMRIEDGTYGICEGTGEPIARARLEASPWSRYSVAYASKVEKGLVQEPERSTEERKKKKKRAASDEDETESEEETHEEEAEEEHEEEEEEEEDEEEEEEDKHEVEFEPLPEEDDDEEEEEGKYY
jgi:DnaK suppressor protein